MCFKPHLLLPLYLLCLCFVIGGSFLLLFEGLTGCTAAAIHLPAAAAVLAMLIALFGSLVPAASLLLASGGASRRWSRRATPHFFVACLLAAIIMAAAALTAMGWRGIRAGGVNMMTNPGGLLIR
jgi:hypothetical protein